MRAVVVAMVSMAAVCGIVAVGRPALPADSKRGAGAHPRVFDISGSPSRPCQPIRTRGTSFVAGGCRARFYAGDTLLMIRTPFGAIEFGDCVSSFSAYIAADGRLWLDNILLIGGSPCGDVWPCAPRRVIERLDSPADLPPRDEVSVWRGRIVARSGDAYRGRFKLCAETCLGRYEGLVYVDFIHDERGWRMRARSAGVGMTGLQIDADWEARGSADFDIRS